MTRPRLRWLLLALCGAGAAPASAGVAELVQVACAAPVAPKAAGVMASAPATAASAPATFDELLRGNPAAARAAGCARWVRGEDRLDSALDIAAALAAAEDNGAAALLDAMQPELAPAPAGAAARVRWQLARGAAHDAAGERTQAFQRYTQARDELRAAGQIATLRYAIALLGQATAWSQLRAEGDLQRAIAAADEASALLASLGYADSLWAGDVFNLRAIVAYAQQDLRGTLRWSQAELALLARHGRGDDPESLHALITLGAVHSQLGEFDAAQDAFERGWPSSRCIPRPTTTRSRACSATWP